MRKITKDQRGVVLVGTVALMVLLSLFGTVGTSMVSTSSGQSTDVIGGTQALAITQAGVEWYLEQLEGTADWSTEVNQTQNFAGGAFAITINSSAEKEINFTVTGTITSVFSGTTHRRVMTVGARKMAPAFLFAVFQGIDPGSNLRIRSRNTNHSTVTGDVWSRGVVQVDANNTVTGTTYVADTEDVVGGGTFTKKLIDPPYLTMPVIDATDYNNLIADFDATIAANASATNRTVTNTNFDIDAANPDCTGSPAVCEFRNFTTNGNGGTVNITGDGTIVANRNINLHNSGVNGASTLNITPDVGGSITFLAGRNLLMGTTQDPTISNTGRTRFYSETTANNQLLRIRGENTSLSSPTIVGGRRILIRDGADITGSATLFLDYPGNNNNNRLDIRGGAGVTSVSGTIISTSRLNNGLRIFNGGNGKTNVSVSGLIYARNDTANLGGCQVQDAVITGSLVCRRFQSNRIMNANVTYSASALPSTAPDGFETFIIKEEDSWQGI